MSHLMTQTTDIAVITHILGSEEKENKLVSQHPVTIACFLVYLSLRSLGINFTQLCCVHVPEARLKK